MTLKKRKDMSANLKTCLDVNFAHLPMASSQGRILRTMLLSALGI